MMDRRFADHRSQSRAASRFSRALPSRRASLVASDYWLNSLIIPAIVMGLEGLGLNLLTGYAGLVPLGYAVFMSIGPSRPTICCCASPYCLCRWRSQAQG